MARGLTLVPPYLEPYAQKAESLTSSILGEYLAPENPVRQVLSAYIHVAGIEAGYGFFAPNVPDNYKLVFELHYPDGQIEYELPRINRPGTALRLVSLLDTIGNARHDSLREAILKMLAYSTWREHPNATMIRAVFGSVHFPEPADFEKGRKETYKVLYAYEFSFSAETLKRREP